MDSFDDVTDDNKRTDGFYRMDFADNRGDHFSLMETADQYPRVPAEFVPAVLAFPECSYGAVRVTLVLKSGRVIYDVILGGDSIAKVGDRLVENAADLDFSPHDIVKILRG